MVEGILNMLKALDSIPSIKKLNQEINKSSNKAS